MKRVAGCVVLALLLLGLGGLSGGREIEERSLITALAADRTYTGVTLTAITGVRASEGEEPQVLTGAGADMETACEAVQQVQATHAYLGQADKLLLGQTLAEGRLMETLEFVMDHRELRLDTLLYIVRGNAGQGLGATAPATAGETPGRDSRGVSVGQVLSRLCAGEKVLAPALAPDEAGQLVPAGWAVLTPSGLTGYQQEVEK